MNDTESKIHLGEVIRTLERIEKQVTLTNGRVSSLEKWRWIVTGVAVSSAIVGGMNLSGIVQAISGI
jgi:hypothetical protein